MKSKGEALHDNEGQMTLALLLKIGYYFLALRWVKANPKRIVHETNVSNIHYIKDITNDCEVEPLVFWTKYSNSHALWHRAHWASSLVPKSQTRCH